MAQELYPLLTPNLFFLSDDPGNAAVYVHPTLAGEPVDNTPLNHTEQATIDTQFARKNHYLLLVNEEHQKGMLHRP